MSPKSLIPFELTSDTTAVLVASIIGFGSMVNTVTSSVVLPSVSMPSSLVSDTTPPVLLAVTVTLLITPPISTED